MALAPSVPMPMPAMEEVMTMREGSSMEARLRRRGANLHSCQSSVGEIHQLVVLPGITPYFCVQMNTLFTFKSMTF